MIFVTIAHQKEELPALKQVVEFATQMHPMVDGRTSNREYRTLLITPKPDELSSDFMAISAEFSRWVARDDVTVLVSQVNPMQLNPLMRQGMESLLAMLILAFPEVQWLFCTIRGCDKSEANEDKIDAFRTTHGLYNLFQPDQPTLFDGAGLRDWVRCVTNEHEETKSDACYIPRREQFAIALDEETDYAHLHAYTAYRFGFCALAISTRAASDAVLSPNAASTWRTPEVILEDLFLNFPDGGRGLSDLHERRKIFPALERAKNRILVTSGQKVAGDAEKNALNKQYIAEQRANDKKIQFLYKPHAGIFSVWEKSGLDCKLCWREKNEKGVKSGKLHRGTGEPYVWPPDWLKIEKKLRDSDDVDSSGHSSPGIFLLIARHLLNRAESMLANGLSSVEEAVHGAVLTNDALELLGGKTPTTAAEALSLKHQFELHAECQFTGVEHHIPLHHRFKEIKRDAESIARWFRPQERRRAALNIQMNIVNKLVCILRQYNQFDEEQECMNLVRHLHNSLYLHEHPWRRFLTWPILRYSEFLLSSFSRFTIALIVWIGGLTWLFSLKTDELDAQSGANNFYAFGSAMKTFFGVDLITSYGPWSIGFSVVAILAGLAHLGIFISHLYVLVSKR